MSETLNITGRLAQGDVFNVHPKKYNDRPVIGPDGNPVHQMYFGVAVDKTDPCVSVVWPHLQAVANAGYPTLQPTFETKDFAWKMVDGDATGKPLLAGKYLFKFTSQGIYHKIVSSVGGGQPVFVTDENMIKRGYYVRVFFTVKCGTDKIKPSIFLNAQVVELVGYGEEISSGPDPRDLIAQAGASTLPAGASQQPVGGLPPAAPAAPPVQPGQPGQMPPAAPAAPAVQPGQPGQMPPAAPPVQPGQMPPAAPPVQPGQMPPAAPYPQILDPANPAAIQGSGSH